MAGADRGSLGQVFNEVPELYDRVHPTYPDELFADLVAVTGIDERSSVLEVGCDPGNLFGPTVVRWYPAVQWFDGTASPISCARRRCTGGSAATFESRSLTRSPSASAPGWATAHHAAT